MFHAFQREIDIENRNCSIIVCVSSGWQRNERTRNTPQREWQLAPTLAVVRRMPDLAIAQPCVYMTRCYGVSQQRIGHAGQGLWQPTRKTLPGPPFSHADDKSLSLRLNISCV